MKKISNHYVPKLYLRNFSKDRKRINLFINENGKYIENAPIKYQGCKDYLYGKDGSIEDFFCFFEDKTAPILRNIISSNTLPARETEEYQFLLYFILLSNIRDTRHADSINDMIDTQMKQIIGIQRRHGIDNLNGIDISKYKLSVDKPNYYPLISSQKIFPILLDLNSVLLYSSCDREYITSDSPVVKYNSFYLERNYYRGYGFVNCGIQIFLPISPKLCILVYDGIMYNIKGEKHGKLDILKGRIIDSLNSLFYLNSYKFLYFSGNVKERYIESLVNDNIHYREQKSPVNVFGGGDNILIALQPHQVLKKINLPFIQINPDLYSMPLPGNMAGPIRPYAKQFIDDKEQ